MYDVSGDRVEELKSVPQSCTGAPMPVVIAEEHHLLLAYLTSQPDPDWDGSYVNVVTNDTESVVAIVTFARPSLHMFGPPNDEAFGGKTWTSTLLCQRDSRFFMAPTPHRDESCPPSAFRLAF